MRLKSKEKLEKSDGVTLQCEKVCKPGDESCHDVSIRLEAGTREAENGAREEVTDAR